MSKAQYDNTVHEDEFHYNKAIAARHADRNALVAAGKSTAAEIARTERRFDAANGNERRAVDVQLKALRADAARLATSIEDMDKEATDG